ncbi:MAG: hypothetical protein Q9169_003588 [Polycauliona sp. 2 TL-2023]
MSQISPKVSSIIRLLESFPIHEQDSLRIRKKAFLTVRRLKIRKDDPVLRRPISIHRDSPDRKDDFVPNSKRDFLKVRKVGTDAPFNYPTAASNHDALQPSHGLASRSDADRGPMNLSNFDGQESPVKIVRGGFGKGLDIDDAPSNSRMPEHALRYDQNPWVNYIQDAPDISGRQKRKDARVSEYRFKPTATDDAPQPQTSDKFDIRKIHLWRMNSSKVAVARILHDQAKRGFSTSPRRPNDISSSAKPMAPEPLSVDQYHRLADQYIDVLVSRLEELQEERRDVDCEYSAGVLTLDFPPAGTYIFNKQPPNKQIWLSSPISGPKRYDYVIGEGKKGEWIYLRDRTTLTGLLREELGVHMDEEG